MIRNFINALLFLLVMVIYNNAIAGWGCTGFFISNTGDIATAAHCTPVNGQLFVLRGNAFVPATLIGADYINDVVIIKITEVNTNSFKLASSNAKHAFIMMAGFPNRMVNGVNLKLYRGYVKAVTGGRLEVEVFGDHGASGAPIFNKYGDVFGVLVAGQEELGVSGSFDIIARSSTALIALAQKHGVVIRISYPI